RLSSQAGIIQSKTQMSEPQRGTNEQSSEVSAQENEWEEIVDVYGSGETYYANKRTNESRWEIPTENEWIPLVNTQTNTTTYLNQYTMVHQQEPPPTVSNINATPLSPDELASLESTLSPEQFTQIKLLTEKPKSIYKIGPPPASMLHIMTATSSFFASMDADMISPDNQHHYDSHLETKGKFNFDSIDAVAVQEEEKLELRDDEDDENDEILQQSRLLDEARLAATLEPPIFAADQDGEILQTTVEQQINDVPIDQVDSNLTLVAPTMSKQPSDNETQFMNTTLDDGFSAADTSLSAKSIEKSMENTNDSTESEVKPLEESIDNNTQSNNPIQQIEDKAKEDQVNSNVIAANQLEVPEKIAIRPTTPLLASTKLEKSHSQPSMISLINQSNKNDGPIHPKSVGPLSARTAPHRNSSSEAKQQLLQQRKEVRQTQAKVARQQYKAQVLSWQQVHNKASNTYYQDVEAMARHQEAKLLLISKERDEREAKKKVMTTQLQNATYSTYDVMSRQLVGYDLKKHFTQIMGGLYDIELNAARKSKYDHLILSNPALKDYWNGVAKSKKISLSGEQPAEIQQRVLTDRNVFGDTLLHAAASKGFVAKAKHVISLGANVNLADNSICKWTPLHEAAHSGNANMVKLLLNAGADLSKQDASGDIALHIACRGGFSTVVKVLLHADHDLKTLSIANYKGKTPLQVVKKASLRIFLQD
ncbi:hypothetical protein THRCLA_09861, partial [Thraustotheca clavata]